MLDGTTGLNMLNQAKEFNDTVQLSGIILTKLDGTARGGAVVSRSLHVRPAIRAEPERSCWCLRLSALPRRVWPLRPRAALQRRCAPGCLACCLRLWLAGLHDLLGTRERLFGPSPNTWCRGSALLAGTLLPRLAPVPGWCCRSQVAETHYPFSLSLRGPEPCPVVWSMPCAGQRGG